MRAIGREIARREAVQHEDLAIRQGRAGADPSERWRHEEGAAARAMQRRRSLLDPQAIGIRLDDRARDARRIERVELAPVLGERAEIDREPRGLRGEAAHSSRSGR